MSTIITLNDTIREVARRNPAALLSLVGMYAATGRVNDLPVEKLEEAINNAHEGARNAPTPKREDFDTDVAYNDQVNQRIIIKALATKFCYGFTADNVPSMIDEMYQRIDNDVETCQAYMGISGTTRRMEEAFMFKAKKELF